MPGNFDIRGEILTSLKSCDNKLSSELVEFWFSDLFATLYLFAFESSTVIES